MWTPTKEELTKIIENHQHWVNANCDGWYAMRADLCEANLNGADLRFANLCRADLYGANLRGADLRFANLNGAYLCGTNLCGANLCEADLYGTNLCGADLYGTNLCGANLCGANLCGAKNIPFIPMACPDSGAFIGWKKAKSSKEERHDWCIIRLEIPSDARRSSATGRKCRCDKAVVLAIESLDGTTIYDHAYSDHDPDFEYKVDETVSVDNFDEDRFNECSTGIHFFINRQEAVDYRF